MFPSSRSRLRPLLAALILLFAAEARADVRLDVAGSVGSLTEDTIEIRIDLANRGTEPAHQLAVAGELFGHEAKGSVSLAIGPGETRGLTLSFPLDGAAPGVHAVVLMLDYRSGPEASATRYSQPAWVLIALGEQSAPSVKLHLTEGRVEVTGHLDVVLESADGAAHRVQLSVRTPHSLRAYPVESVVDVPAQGSITQSVRLFRVDAPWNSRQGLLVIARDDTGPLLRTAVEAGTAQLSSDPARLPRLRRPLIGLALLLLAAAVAAEIWKRRTPAAI